MFSYNFKLNNYFIILLVAIASGRCSVQSSRYSKSTVRRCYDGDDVAQHFPVENSPSSDTETQTGERLSKRTLQEFLPSGSFLNKEYQVSFSPKATKSDQIKEENLDGAFGSKYLSRRAVKQEISKVKRSNAENEHNLPADYKLHGYEDISRSPSASSLADKITSRLDHYLGKHSHEKVSANGDGSKSLDDAYKYFVDEVEGSHSDQATKNESKNHVTRGDDPPLIFRSPSNSSAVACAGGNCDTAKDGRHSSRHVGRDERQFSEWNQRKLYPKYKIHKRHLKSVQLPTKRSCRSKRCNRLKGVQNYDSRIFHENNRNNLKFERGKRRISLTEHSGVKPSP